MESDRLGGCVGVSSNQETAELPEPGGDVGAGEGIRV